jgi:hypothetical protein
VKPTDADRDLAFDRLIARGLDKETDASGRACPDADLLAAWFDRSLSPAEAARVESHAAACKSCQQILADLARSEPQVVRAAPLPAESRPWHWHWRWLVPLATAAVVVVVAGRTLRAPVRFNSSQEEAQWNETAAKLKPPPPPPAQALGQEARAEAGAPSADVAAPAREARPQPPSPASPAPPAPAPRMAAVPKRADASPAGVGAGEGLPAQASADAARNAAGAVAENRPMTRETVVPLPSASGGAASRAEPAPPLPPAAAVAQKSAPTMALSEVALIPAVASSPSGKTWWRAGRAGSIDRSTDGRRSWQAQQVPAAGRLAAISVVNDTTCWAVGAGGTVVRTVDAAAWQRTASPAAADLVAVQADSDVAATVTTADHATYRTTDGGKTWTRTRRP